jgi:hypothetical protein
MNCSSTNGRLNILDPPMNQFSLYDKIPTSQQCETFHDAMTGNFTESTLSRMYFSNENIRIIQNSIRAGVYEISNHQYMIDDQNCDILKIIMRSVFLQSSTNLPNNIRQQIESLNKIVVEYCVKQIYSEAQGYINYKHDVSNMYTPMDRPVQPDYNNKTLELNHWF